EVAGLAGADSLLVELGSGASRKVRLMLEALQPAGYLGMDISREFLLTCTQRLAEDYPWLQVSAACVDYSGEFQLPLHPGQTPLAFFPGSSIGNFHPEEALALLQRIHRALGPGAGLLIGVDIKKDTAILDAAYNDAAGVTASFNLNLLERMRRELGARLDPDGFEHHAFYNADQGRVEMHLRSRGRQVIEVDGETHRFEDGETIHTECSYKYAPEEFRALAAEAGYTTERTWLDDDELFSLHFLRSV
ncbi:MAG: L-histidine N(alpha)-methyltransferase, partial [Thiohalospira sp.]